MLFPTVQSTASELCKGKGVHNLRMVFLWLGFLHAEESSAKGPIKTFMQETRETTYYQMETRGGSITSITVPNHNEDPRLICCINIK